MNSRPRGQLTGRQLEVAREFEERARDGRPPPTYRELCKIFGWASSATARDSLRGLARKGVLVHARGKARGFCLADPDLGRLPLLGTIVAGVPEYADQQSTEYVAVPSSWATREGSFAVRVRGDSMKDAGIVENDVVVVRKTAALVSGAIVAATVDGKTTLKRLRRDKRGRYWLHPENRSYRSIKIADTEAIIHGTVVGLLREYHLTEGQ